MIRPCLAGVLLDAETGSRIELLVSTPPWAAFVEWLRFHDVDPGRIPAGTTVHVDRAARAIRYQRTVLDENGRISYPKGGRVATEVAVEQGEGLAPYPPEIAALLSEATA